MTDPDDRDTIRTPTPRGRGPTVSPGERRLSPVRGAAAAAPIKSPEPSPRGESKERSFNPFKFQRITLPPGLRLDFFRWSRAARHEKPPFDTLLPQGGAAPPANAAPPARAGTPRGSATDSVSPMGVSTLPVRATRGLVAVAVFVAIASLVALAVATLGRGRARSNVATASDSMGGKAAHPIVDGGVKMAPSAQPASPPTVMTAPAPAPGAPRAPIDARSERDTPASAPPSRARQSKSAPTALHPADSPRPGPTSESAPRVRPNEDPLDRPFSTPQ